MKKKNMKYNKETFEDFLARMHMIDEPTVLDDDLPDAFSNWLQQIDMDMIILYAEMWHTEQLLALLNNK